MIGVPSKTRTPYQSTSGIVFLGQHAMNGNEYYLPRTYMDASGSLENMGQGSLVSSQLAWQRGRTLQALTLRIDSPSLKHGSSKGPINRVLTSWQILGRAKSSSVATAFASSTTKLYGASTKLSQISLLDAMCACWFYMPLYLKPS